MSEIWCNDRWLPADRYPGVAQDRGAFLGLGLFETMLAIEGELVFATRHLARLTQSCTRFGWPCDFPDLPKVARELLVRNQLGCGDARVRLIVTAGSGLPNNLTAGPDRLVWLAGFPISKTNDAVAVCLSPWPRNERSALAGLKTSCYAENLIALDHARRLGFDEIIFLNTAGQLCEAATANLFLVKDGVLLTPPPASGCLPGIGREVISALARGNGITVEERALDPGDLHSADEIFLSSATRGPIAVSRFENRDFSSSPVTAAIQKLWHEATRLKLSR